MHAAVPGNPLPFTYSDVIEIFMKPQVWGADSVTATVANSESKQNKLVCASMCVKDNFMDITMQKGMVLILIYS